MTLTGPGPMPNTVILPAAICVRPLDIYVCQLECRYYRWLTHASLMVRAQRLSAFALASKSSNSSSELHFSATFA